MLSFIFTTVALLHFTPASATAVDDCISVYSALGDAPDCSHVSTLKVIALFPRTQHTSAKHIFRLEIAFQTCCGMVDVAM